MDPHGSPGRRLIILINVWQVGPHQHEIIRPQRLQVVAHHPVSTTLLDVTEFVFGMEVPGAIKPRRPQHFAGEPFVGRIGEFLKDGFHGNIRKIPQLVRLGVVPTRPFWRNGGDVPPRRTRVTICAVTELQAFA